MEHRKITGLFQKKCTPPNALINGFMLGSVIVIRSSPAITTLYEMPTHQEFK